jgi:uncharacterized protein
MRRMRFCVIVMGAAALAGCDKLPPEEIVYTGPKMDGGMSAMDASIVLPMGDGGSDPVSTVMPQCGPRPEAVATFSKAAFLDGIGQCAQLRYCEFEAYQRDLTDKVGAFTRDPSTQNREAARSAWTFANASWQKAELFRIGPAAPAMDPGGQGLRDDIHVFPLFDRCRVDEQTVSKAYESPDFPNSLETGRTLQAIEYLVFYDGLDNGCSPFASINTNQTWATLPEDERRARKRAYADVVARDVDGRARALIDAWHPAKGNFQQQLASAGMGSQVYPAQQDALNALGAAMFYLDRELKDSKLSLPLGITIDCTQDCAGRVESRYARISTRNIQENLVGFREIFQGCSAGNAGLGVDDWLRSVGAGDLADRMLALLDDAEAAARALPSDLEAVIRTNPAAVDALRLKVKAITDLMKTEMNSVLDIELPMNLEGDND